jgi:coiled-coil and C2 domain-containing protein 2A
MFRVCQIFDFCQEFDFFINYFITRLEKIRREVLSKTRIFVKILFNGKVVYKTTKLSLRSDFTVEWGQIFNIYMINWPESIRLLVFEFCENVGPLKRKVNETFVAEIILPVPEANCTCNNYDLEKYEFSSANEFYMSKGNDVTSYYQSGVLYTGAGWGVDKNSNLLIPPTILGNNYLQKTLQNCDAIAALGVSRMQDPNELAKWIFKSNLDPNDPRNADLIDLIQVCVVYS